jgi:hypothetical protein
MSESAPEEHAAWARKEARRVAYETGQYRIEVPYVTTGGWDVRAWMRWIDACDGWYNPTLRDPL